MIRGSAASIAAGPFLFQGTTAQAKNSSRTQTSIPRRKVPGTTHKSTANRLLGFQDDCLAKGGRAAICMRRKTGSDEYHGRELQLRRKNKLRGHHTVIDHCYLLARLGSQTAVHRAVRSNAADRIALIRDHHFVFMMMSRHSVAMMMRSRLSYTMRSEERRVGKECRTRWSQVHVRK